MGRLIRRFLDARRGVAAVEFALMAPVLLMLAFGAVEFAWRLDAAERVTRAAGDTADLIGQSETLTTSQLTDLRALTARVLDPMAVSVEILSIDVASVGYEAAAPTVRVLWRRSQGQALSLDLSTLAGLADAGESVVWVGVRYRYRPAFHFVFPAELAITREAVARPRLTRRIALDGQLEWPS